jgi:hypothetical protein
MRDVRGPLSKRFLKQTGGEGSWEKGGNGLERLFFGQNPGGGNVKAPLEHTYPHGFIQTRPSWSGTPGPDKYLFVLGGEAAIIMIIA